jgi:DNA-binding GntR family transcriptional regulator
MAHSDFSSGAPARVDRRLSVQTYDALRLAIVQGRVRPNQRLIESELAEEYGVSRTPIRESLQRLSTEGLIVPARSGWSVREHSLDEIREIYEVRAALESYAARLAAERGDPGALAEVADIVRARAFAPPPEGERGQLVPSNDRFHTAIITAAGNDRLRLQIRQNAEYFFNYQVANLYTPEEIRCSAAQHEAISQALLRRDADAAERIMREHVGEALAVILDRLR